jgi:hypothetical protein
MVRKNEKFLTQIYALMDFITIQVVFLLAWWLKFESNLIPHENPIPINDYAIWSLVYGAITI